MQNRKFDIAYIRRYVRGELSPKEMHALERAAEADGMLMDLILGVETEHAQNLPKATDDLQQRIDARTRPVNGNIRRPWKLLRIAASLLAVIGVSTYLFLWSPLQQQEDKIATAEIDSPYEGEQDSPAADAIDSPKLALKKTEQAPPSRMANSTAKPERQAAEPAPAAKTPQAELSADFVLDSTTRLVAQAPSKRAESMEITAPQAYRKQIGDAQGQTIRIRGINSIASNTTKQTIVFGKVLDSETNAPLPHTVIKDLISNKAIKADSLGRFFLVSDSDQVNLAMNHVGYASRQLLTGTSELEIRLHPQDNSLNEVVVTGYGRKSPVPRKSSPVGGWPAFERYIKKSAKVSGLTTGAVTLRFDIDESGDPSNIHVEKSVSTAHDAKAIQLLKDGPKWSPGRLDQDIKVTVRFTN